MLRQSGTTLLVGAFIGVLLCANASFAQTFNKSEAAHKIVISDQARRIHAESLLIDGHNDLPWMMRKMAGLSFEQVDIAKPTTNHTDIPRLKKGGVGAQFWAAYVPSRTMVTGGAARETIEQIDFIHRMVERYPETFAFAGTAREIEQIRKKGKIACLIGVEGGHSIEKSLGLLRTYYRLGVRYMTLTHADNVGWADAGTDTPQSNGLNEFGSKVVAEMNRLGMLVDISHVSVATMHAALDVSKAPVIASHSSAFAIAQHPRNVPDDVLKRIKQNGGVVMLNFYSGFVSPEAAGIMAEAITVVRELRQKFTVDDEYNAAVRAWKKEHPIPRASVHELMKHLQHIVKMAGIDHVGLGADFDGVDVLPDQLEDVSCYPVVTQAMLDAGFSEQDIKKVLGANLLRVLRQAEGVSRTLKPEPPL